MPWPSGPGGCVGRVQVAYTVSWRYNGTTPELLGPLSGLPKGNPQGTTNSLGVRAGKTRGQSPKVLADFWRKFNPLGPEKSGSRFLMAKNLVAPRDLETSQTPETDPLDPTQATFFIKYEPEIAEKLANLKKVGVSVSGRCLSIVFSRLYFWSRYAKHKFEKKLFFWKSQRELAIETGFSEKQINRALKALVDLGLLIREKFHKRFWRQVYFYHVPVSPFTKELQPRPCSRALEPVGAADGHPAASLAAPRAPEGGLQHQSGSNRPQGPGAASGSRKINGAEGFGPIPPKCPDERQQTSTSKKQTSRSLFQNIMQRCEFYGAAENYQRIFGNIA
jgi:hypothetical protein